LAVSRLERPRSCGNAVSRTNLDTATRWVSVACQGQFWTATKAPNTGFVLADTRATELFTSALCSDLHIGVGLDTNIVYVGRYVADKSTKLKVKYRSKVYRRRWEDKRVLRKEFLEAQTVKG